MRADTVFEHFDVIYSRESTKIPPQMQIIFEFLNRFTRNSRGNSIAAMLIYTTAAKVKKKNVR